MMIDEEYNLLCGNMPDYNGQWGVQQLKEDQGDGMYVQQERGFVAASKNNTTYNTLCWCVNNLYRGRSHSCCACYWQCSDSYRRSSTLARHTSHEISLSHSTAGRCLLWSGGGDYICRWFSVPIQRCSLRIDDHLALHNDRHSASRSTLERSDWQTTSRHGVIGWGDSW